MLPHAEDHSDRVVWAPIPVIGETVQVSALLVVL